MHGCVGKRLQVLPSHPALGEPQSFSRGMLTNNIKCENWPAEESAHCLSFTDQAHTPLTYKGKRWLPVSDRPSSYTTYLQRKALIACHSLTKLIHHLPTKESTDCLSFTDQAHTPLTYKGKHWLPVIYWPSSYTNTTYLKSFGSKDIASVKSCMAALYSSTCAISLPRTKTNIVTGSSNQNLLVLNMSQWA